MKYVVYLVIYSGDVLPKYYIGSTSFIKATSGKYFGSVRSKKWKCFFDQEIKENIEKFDIQILSYHETRKEALEKELEQQIKRNCVNSNEYFNESYASPRGFFGRGSITENQKKLSSERMKKINRGEIKGRKKGNNKSGKHQDNLGHKNPMYGKIHKKESKEKNSNSVKLSRKLKVKCHCGKSVDVANFKRWHDEKCIQKNTSNIIVEL